MALWRPTALHVTLCSPSYTHTYEHMREGSPYPYWLVNQSINWCAEEEQQERALSDVKTTALPPHSGLQQMEMEGLVQPGLTPGAHLTGRGKRQASTLSRVSSCDRKPPAPTLQSTSLQSVLSESPHLHPKTGFPQSVTLFIEGVSHEKTLPASRPYSLIPGGPEPSCLVFLPWFHPLALILPPPPPWSLLRCEMIHSVSMASSRNTSLVNGLFPNPILYLASLVLRGSPIRKREWIGMKAYKNIKSE